MKLKEPQVDRTECEDLVHNGGLPLFGFSALPVDYLSTNGMKTYDWSHLQNPKEVHAWIMTIQTYVKQQGELLEAKAKARARTWEDAQRVDAKVRDTYTQLIHRSVYDLGNAQLSSDDGVRIRIQPRMPGEAGQVSPKAEAPWTCSTYMPVPY